MIYYLVTDRHHYTMRQYLQSWGRDLARAVQVVPYAALPRNRELPVGTYIFSDIERLNALQRPLVSGVWEQLARAGNAVRLLNHPTRSLRRHDLLRCLHERGINRFNAFLPSEPGQPWRYPVFLRQENEHTGSLSPLLRNKEEVRQALLTLVMDGYSPRDLLVVELCDTADGEGVYRKYAAFRVGDRILPRHVLFSRSWVLKDLDLLEPSHREEVRHYCRTNPHEEQLLALFNLAGIQYGRIDYALLDGAIQVWEINTNPVVMRPPEQYPPASLPFHEAFSKVFGEALLQVDTPHLPPVERVPIDLGSAPGWES
jgi:hypothetical protein